MQRRGWFSGAVLLAAVASGCASDDVAPADGGQITRDSGPVADAGVRAQCPLPENQPTCEVTDDCGAGNPVNASTCGWICDQLVLRESLCQVGQCETPEKLPLTQDFEVSVDIVGLVGDVNSFLGIALAAETAGGLRVGCDEVMDDPEDYDWMGPCHNILDVRAYNLSGGGEEFPVRFGSFPGGERVLFVVYGFAEEQTQQSEPVGVTCVEVDVPGAGEVDGTTTVDTDTMERI